MYSLLVTIINNKLHVTAYQRCTARPTLSTMIVHFHTRRLEVPDPTKGKQQVQKMEQIWKDIQKYTILQRLSLFIFAINRAPGILLEHRQRRAPAVYFGAFV
jgi:hypothetical protein